MILQNLNIQKIADSGQCFRIRKINENRFTVISAGKYAELEQLNDTSCYLECFEVDTNFWLNYFAMNENYEEINERILEEKNEFVKKSTIASNGLRVLNQEFVETLLSFIISQRKAIPQIEQCIERLCSKYGDTKTAYNGKIYKTFPALETLKTLTTEDFVNIGVGYRAEYLRDAIVCLENGTLNVNNLQSESLWNALTTLKFVHGVGDKVANCVALYSLGFKNAFPVDVWIERIMKREFGYNSRFQNVQDIVGIVQLYMFYYERNKLN